MSEGVSSSRTYSTVWAHFTILEEDGISFICKIYCYFTIIIRKKYKRTGGNTTSLYNHVNTKHPNKIETETENTGDMDKFITKNIPVSIYSFFISLFIF